MNKFKHFNEKEIKTVKKLNQIKWEITDRYQNDDGCDNHDYDESVVLVSSGWLAREHSVDILNAALDAHLVERVYDFQNDTQSEKIEDKYTLKKLPDGKIWMMENLREKVNGAVWNEEYNCYMYTWEQAKKAVPQGFHLPSAEEFMELCLACGYSDKSDEEVVKTLQDECGFVMSGWANIDGNLHSCGSEGNWWSSTWYTFERAYSLLFFSSCVAPQLYTAKTTGLAVRCIKD